MAAQLNGSGRVTGGPSPLSAYEAASSEAFEAAVDQLLALLQPLPFADPSERQRTEAGVRAAFANAEYSTMQAAEGLWSEAQRDLNGKLKAQTLQMNLKLERARTASKVEKQQVAVVLAEEHTKAREEEERQRLERERTGGNPRLTEAHQQINNLTLELEDIRSTKKELETTLTQMELSVYQAQVKANRLEQSNQMLLEDNNAWMADGKEAKAALGQVQSALDAATSMQVLTTASLALLSPQVQAALDAATGDGERMMARISELVQQRDELSASLEAAEADLGGASAAQAEAVRLAVASANARLASTEAELRAKEADLHALRASLADDGGNQALQLLALRREAEEHQRQLEQSALTTTLLSARVAELTTALADAEERERGLEHAREQAEQSWAARVSQAEQQLGVAQVELDAVREVAHQVSSADTGVKHWRMEAERRQQTISTVETALATARAKLEMVQNKPLGEQVHELIERSRRAERALDAARLELARTSRAMEYAFSELEFVLEAADSRVRQVRERAKQQKAQLVRAALESLTQLRSHLTEAMSGLRGPPLQGKQGNQMPLQVADQTDERLEFRQWRHRWGTTFRRDAGDLLSESGFGAPPVQRSEAAGSPGTGGGLGGGVSQIVLKKHAPGVACAEQNGAAPGTPQPPRHPRPGGGRAIPRSAPGARSVALSVAPPGGTAIPLSFALTARALSPRQPSTALTTAHALEEPFGSWPANGATVTAPWQHQQHRLAQQQQQLGRLDEHEQQLQLEQQLEQLQQRLVKQQLEDLLQSKAAAAAAQPTALPHSLHYLLPGGERFPYKGVAHEARANTPELEAHKHMHVPGPAPPSSPESVPVGVGDQPTG